MGPRFASRRVQFGTWLQDGNPRPSFADEQVASQNDNCLEDSACALLGECETLNPAILAQAIMAQVWKL